MGYREGPPRFHVRPPLLKKISFTFHIYRRFLIFLSFFLIAVLTLVINYSDTKFASQMRGFIYETTRPIATLAHVPYEGWVAVKDWIRDWIWTFQRVTLLEKENLLLKKKAERYREIYFENVELRKLANFIKTDKVRGVTVNVLAYPGRPYVKSILVNGGSQHSIKIRQAVVQEGGVVGRTLDVGAYSSRVLLLNDLNSKIPVFIRGTNEHAILAGDNSPYPILKYLPGNTKIKIGDRVETSGRGGIFKPGMPIGYVIKVTPLHVKVKPYVPLENLKYVIIMDSHIDPFLNTLN